MDADVLNAVVARMKADAFLSGLTGATAADSRIYYYHKGDAIIDSVRPAFITFMNLGEGESRQGVTQPVISMVIWARTNERASAVRDALKLLFNKQTLATTTSRAYRTRIVHEQDTYNEQTNYVGKQLHLRPSYRD